MGFKEAFGKVLSEDKIKKLIDDSINLLPINNKVIVENDLLENNRNRQLSKNKDIGIGRQLLLLHYLGLLKEMDFTNIKKASLLSVIMNTDGTENIRKSLSNIGGNGSTYLTKDNLNYLLSLFKRLELEDLQNKVQKDLDKISKKQAQ